MSVRSSFPPHIIICSYRSEAPFCPGASAPISAAMALSLCAALVADPHYILTLLLDNLICTMHLNDILHSPIGSLICPRVVKRVMEAAMPRLQCLKAG